MQQQQQPVQPAAPPVALETHPMNLASPVPPTDPMVRKQVVQDLMAQMQGTYNFMQVRSACQAQELWIIGFRTTLIITSVFSGLHAGV